MNKKDELYLTIFGGWLGLHLFAKKNIKKGILYLFTCGIFFIGWFYDIYVAYKNYKKYIISKNIQNNFENKYYKIDGNDITNLVLNKEKEINDYIVLDFETTGIDTYSDDITEFTFLKYHNHKLVDELSHLVNPKRKIPDNVSKITGITDEMVKNEKSIDYYIDEIINFIDSYTLIGHNISKFDYYFLKNAIKRNKKLTKDLNYECVDTLIMARKLINDVENHKLETLKKYLNIELISHRSKQDCEVTAQLFEYMIKK